MVDVLLAEQLPLLQRIPDSHWWDRLVVIAQGIRSLAGPHPSAFSLLLSRPSITPDALKATDAVYQALGDAGVPEPQVPRVERSVQQGRAEYAGAASPSSNRPK